MAGPIATLLIENPGKRNALSAEMWQQFEPLLAALAVDPAVKVLVVRGAGENFSAGADIADLDRILPRPRASSAGNDGVDGGISGAGISREVISGDGGVMTPAENALAAFPKPTVAAIDGYCVGGGWEVAGACDIRIASDRSTFGITPSRLGIVYPLSGIARLVSIAGPAVAKYLLFSGELVPAAEALAFGLVSKIIPAANFWGEVDDFATTLAGRSQFSIQAMKQLIGAIEAIDDAGLGDSGLAALATRWQHASSEDRAIGVAAFLGKYPPEFSWGSGQVSSS